MSERKADRQFSKSQLLKATRYIYEEQERILAGLARKWKRRLAAASLAAFVLGVVVGRLL